MSILNVYNDSASKAQTAEAPKEFKGHYVKDGQVQKTWGEWFMRTDISTLRNEFNESQKPAEKKTEEESYFWKPFSFIGSIFSSVLNFVTDLFQKIFCCFGDSEAKASENTEKKKADNN